MTGQAAQASWLQQTTPSLGGSSTWEFTAVSCTSPNVCMAVGSLDATSADLLAESRSPSGWTTWSVPEPVEGSTLLGVDCASAKSCEAVGSTPLSGVRPLAERWNGTGWQIQTTPKPAGFSASQLNGISCTSPGSCIAVGDATKGGRTVSFAERLRSGVWSLLSTPAVRRASATVLNGVACPSASECLAVGYADRGTDKALAERWDGSKWLIQKVPSLPGSSAVSQLNDVSCTSAKACLAVGFGLSDRWNGSKWTLEKLARPSGHSADLVGVSCVRAGVCYAAGSFYLEGIQNSTAEYWSGGKWSAASVPLSTSSDTSGLSGISCSTATNCTAVGGYHDPVDGERGLAEDFSLRWQDVSPSPFFNVVATGLNAVSCTGPNACVAVGSFESTGSVFETFSEAWSDGSWDSMLPPKPKISNLSGISCVSTSFCIAVGDIIRGGLPFTLTERWTGAGWIILNSPSPANATRSFLSAVSCQSAKMCAAVGFYSGHGGKQFTLAERWNGKSWKIEHTPALASGLASLNAVSCPTAGSCQAVGGTSAGQLAEQWNGKDWSLRQVPTPKGGKSASLSDVSCTSAAACTAVGGYVHGTRLLPLVERWSGKSWKTQTAVPVPATKTSALSAVSCTSATACEATGFASTPTEIATSEHWNGRKWSLHQIPLPSNGQSDEVSGLSCNSKTACLAVGSYQDNTATELMLAEQYS